MAVVRKYSVHENNVIVVDLGLLLHEGYNRGLNVGWTRRQSLILSV